MKSVLTAKELAQRWGVHEGTIRRYIQDGILSKSKIPGGAIYFSIDYIESLEQCEELDPMSPMERKKLINKIEQLEHENEKYKKIIAEAQMLLTKAVFNIEERKDW